MNAIEGSGSFPFRFYLSISARRVACIYLQLSIAHISPHQIKWKKKSRNKTGLCVSVLSLRKRVASQLRRAFYLLFGSNGSNQHQTRFHIPFYFHLSSLLFCHAPLFSFALDFSLRSAWKGFMRIAVMASAWDVLSILFFFFTVSFVNCQRKSEEMPFVAHTHRHAANEKGSKSVGRLQEIFEQFMNLCICYTLCCVCEQTSCLGIAHAVLVVKFFSFRFIDSQ